LRIFHLSLLEYHQSNYVLSFIFCSGIQLGPPLWSSGHSFRLQIERQCLIS
jgi:hypothetical protein